ncbi:Dolichol kinase [Halalkaliarchaeum sp. AArc-CO]|uniref:dolichol kinase n=1 Tax=Halalkaliarchaeum sp. AArc-CO TaxID=2866381 RepID=UPI00217D9ED0|nr:dolichol kinase [Halalkaliarchaeum sp. AArc-CO]UWG52324.1 Dolichol kinase [Halalkaliarchaeum sp. AArc-CO]
MSLELGRRTVHATGAGLPALWLLGAPWWIVQLLLAVALAVALVLEYLRLVVGLDHWVYRKLTRPYEDDSVAGYALYMVSMAAVGFVFVPSIAVPGMLMLALGDPFSGMLGSGEVGGWKAPDVLAATFGFCFLLAAPFTVSTAGVAVGALAAAVGALGATVADGATPVVAGYVIDDNLTIPPAACLGIALVYFATGIPVEFALSF